MKKLILLIAMVITSFEVFADRIYKGNSCYTGGETLYFEANTRSKEFIITDIKGAKDADWATLMNPFYISQDDDTRILASKSFYETMKLANVKDSSLLRGSRLVKVNWIIELKANKLLYRLTVDENGLRTYQGRKDIDTFLRNMGFSFNVNGKNTVVDGGMYRCSSIRISRDFAEEEREAREKKERERISYERRLEEKREKERLQREREEKERNTPTLIGTGTGFYINEKGYIATNYHVIDGCQYVKQDKNVLDLVITDPVNDLAILKSQESAQHYLSFSREKIKKGEEIYVIGYPFGKILSSDSKTTKGIVSSLQGLANNYSNFQIDSAVQPGNSGGPILNPKGFLVGVTVATADYKIIFKAFDVLPQNINFGIKASVLKNILESNEVNFTSEQEESFFSFFDQKKNVEEVLSDADKATLYLECWGTLSDDNNKKKHNQLTLLKSRVES